MDRSALTRKRQRDAPQPARPTTQVQVLRDKRSAQAVSQVRTPQQQQQQQQQHTASYATHRSAHSAGKIRTAKDSSEIIRAKRGDAQHEDKIPEEDPGARHFTVGNVGAGGTLYLKPSRLPPQPFNVPPATPPGTADGAESTRTVWPSGRVSDMSLAGWPPRGRGSAYDRSVPMPPLSLANVQAKRRPRSHSFSTVSERERVPALDSTDVQDFQFLVNDRGATNQRPKSSIELASGYLNLHIPHYRLGTPQFSERGTAYLHNSMYTSTTDDMRSSVMSRAEFDKLQLFPAPPGRPNGTPKSYLSRHSSLPYLHPSRAVSASTRTPPTPPKSASPKSGASVAVYDQIEANANDPSTVRYSSQTGRIVAATPARLIAQITSPRFLDYALLSDFLLTYRSFLTSGELLEHLFARLKWAIGNASDSGRIARVRTFVALRHWMLNYFEDDFTPDFALRSRFCEVVNAMVKELKWRADKGGSDLDIVGELKKCWRRTCTKYWSISDPMDASADTDIEPGGDQDLGSHHVSAISLPLSLRRDRVGDSHQAAMAQQSAKAPEIRTPFRHRASSNYIGLMPPRTRTTSIPASPMSEQSLQVISCSVPFLRNMCPPGQASRSSNLVGPRPVAQRNPPISLDQIRPSHQHKRSGSFSDALRDERVPLPSASIDSTDLKDISKANILGGLIRGLTLQPCPSKLDVLVPLTPGVEPVRSRIPGTDDQYFDDPRAAQHLGVKRIVGDVRRALSSRMTPGDSPTRSHRSGSSSGSRGSNHLRAESGQEGLMTASTFQQPLSQPRFDVLGSTIEETYLEACQIEDAEQKTAQPADLMESEKLERKTDDQEVAGAIEHLERNRVMSQVTTSSQSIMIVDATGPPELPMISRALPSVSSWSTSMTPAPLLFRPAEELLDDIGEYDYFGAERAHRMAEESGSSFYHEDRHSVGPPAQNSFSYPKNSFASRSAPDVLDLPIRLDRARKSPGIQSPELDMPPVRNQLRRRPGGDLKAADHVHELEPEARVYSDGSMSTISRSVPTSAVLSRELSGTHFSRQDLPSQLAGLRSPGQVRDSYSLLETPLSQPFMRPSMEADALKFSACPDSSPGGGIEDALMKLEGTYSNESPTRQSGRVVNKRASTTAVFNQSRDSEASGFTRQTRLVSLPASGDEVDFDLMSPGTDRQGASIYYMSGSDAYTDPITFAASEQTDERSIAPVLPRASYATRFPIDEPDSGRSSAHSVSSANINTHQAQYDHHELRASEANIPKSAVSQGSFLLDDNESLSEISTELGDRDEEEESLGVRSFFFDDTVEDESLALSSFHPPPTPPSTVGAHPEHSPERKIIRDDELRGSARALKGAASAPKIFTNELRKAEVPKIQEPPLRRVRTSPEPQPSSHLPFILAFDSAVIAEQLTIIEKDALDEIDWKDFVGLKWQQNPPHIRNWVSYLQQNSEDTNGIDLVIARFNLAVKWVVSECILTQQTSERARAITKFIHVANHALRLRNYASMYQITLALLSSDLARLRRTWALVAPAEKATLKRLEQLCQPIRNFQALRAEMEAASLEHGCIPFIGLYTHDLMYNAQKPARIDAAPPGAGGGGSGGGKEALVNFERYQTAASIAKGLLRLLEASSRYECKPQPECLSRCLWLAALEDGDIAERSRALE